MTDTISPRPIVLHVEELIRRAVADGLQTRGWNSVSNETLQARNEILHLFDELMEAKKKAAALLARLDEISVHPSYRAQVDIAYAHGHRYTGPDFRGVADELRQALAAVDKSNGT